MPPSSSSRTPSGPTSPTPSTSSTSGGSKFSKFLQPKSSSSASSSGAGTATMRDRSRSVNIPAVSSSSSMFTSPPPPPVSTSPDKDKDKRAMYAKRDAALPPTPGPGSPGADGDEDDDDPVLIDAPSPPPPQSHSTFSRLRPNPPQTNPSGRASASSFYSTTSVSTSRLNDIPHKLTGWLSHFSSGGGGGNGLGAVAHGEVRDVLSNHREKGHRLALPGKGKLSLHHGSGSGSGTMKGNTASAASASTPPPSAFHTPPPSVPGQQQARPPSAQSLSSSTSSTGSNSGTGKGGLIAFSHRGKATVDRAMRYLRDTDAVSSSAQGMGQGQGQGAEEDIWVLGVCHSWADVPLPSPLQQGHGGEGGYARESWNEDMQRLSLSKSTPAPAPPAKQSQTHAEKRKKHGHAHHHSLSSASASTSSSIASSSAFIDSHSKSSSASSLLSDSGLPSESSTGSKTIIGSGSQSTIPSRPQPVPQQQQPPLQAYGQGFPPSFHADFSARLWLTYRKEFREPIRDGRLGDLPSYADLCSSPEEYKTRENERVDLGAVSSGGAGYTSSSGAGTGNTSASSGSNSKGVPTPSKNRWVNAGLNSLGLGERTMRSGILGEKGWTSDTGWGCMLRTGQCLLAEGLMRVWVGRDYKPLAPEAEAARTLERAKYVRVVSWFLDSPSPEVPFSVHRMALAGKELGKDVGMWFGPSTASGALRTLVGAFPQAKLGVSVASDSVLYQTEVYAASFTPPSTTSGSGVGAGGGGQHPYGPGGTVKRPSARRNSGSSGAPSTASNANKGAQGGWGDRAVLVLFGIRLGLEGVNPIYYETVKKLYHIPYLVGIAGGRPSSSYYFVGAQGDHLFYLDPHHARGSVPLRPVPPPLFAGEEGRMDEPLLGRTGAKKGKGEGKGHVKGKESGGSVSERERGSASPSVSRAGTKSPSPSLQQQTQQQQKHKFPHDDTDDDRDDEDDDEDDDDEIEEVVQVGGGKDVLVVSSDSDEDDESDGDGGDDGEYEDGPSATMARRERKDTVVPPSVAKSRRKRKETAKPPRRRQRKDTEKPLPRHPGYEMGRGGTVKASKAPSTGLPTPAASPSPELVLSDLSSSSVPVPRQRNLGPEGGSTSSVATPMPSSSSVSRLQGKEEVDRLAAHYLDSYSVAELRTFHCERVRRMPMSGLDPSMLIGFLVADEEEWVDLRRRVAELPKAIFSIQDEPPTWSADFDMSSDDIGLESILEPDEQPRRSGSDNSQDDEEDEEEDDNDNVLLGREREGAGSRASSSGREFETEEDPVEPVTPGPTSVPSYPGMSAAARKAAEPPKSEDIEDDWVDPQPAKRKTKEKEKEKEKERAKAGAVKGKPGPPARKHSKEGSGGLTARREKPVPVPAVRVPSAQQQQQQRLPFPVAEAEDDDDDFLDMGAPSVGDDGVEDEGERTRKSSVIHVSSSLSGGFGNGSGSGGSGFYTPPPPTSGSGFRSPPNTSGGGGSGFRSFSPPATGGSRIRHDGERERMGSPPPPPKSAVSAGSMRSRIVNDEDA